MPLMPEAQAMAARFYGQVRGVHLRLSELLTAVLRETPTFHGLLELEGGLYASKDDVMAGLIGYQATHGADVTLRDLLLDELATIEPSSPAKAEVDAKLEGLITLQLTVAYDRRRFDPDRICEAVDQVLQNALDTPDILSEVGNPSVSSLEIVIGDDIADDVADWDDDEEEENTVTCRVCGHEVPDYDASSAEDGEGSICHRCQEQQEHEDA